MKLANAHVITREAYINERIDGWRIGESVWDWLLRKTNIQPSKSNIKRLADEMFIGEATIHRLKKTAQHSLNRESLRELIAKYKFEIPGFKEEISMGSYGYPNGIRYIAAPESDAAQTQQKINLRIRADFKKIVGEYDESESICNFCQPISYELIPDKHSRPTKCKTIFLSTHRSKQYGAASKEKGKGFELEITLCRTCLNKHTETFLLPVSSLIEKIIKKYRLKQPQLANELNVPQGVISRLLHDKTVFINPSLLKKIYGLYHIGPDSYYRSEHWKLLLVIVDHLADKLSYEEMCSKMEEYDPEDPIWKYNPSLLEEMDVIGPTESDNIDLLEEYQHPNILFEEQQVELSHCNTKFLGLNFDSNEISCWYEIDFEYSRMVYYPDVETIDCGGGTVILKYVLINIQRRLNWDFWREDSLPEQLQIDYTDY